MESNENSWDLLLKEKSYEKLLQSTKEAISLNPKDPKAFYYSAKAFLYSRRYQEGLEILNKLLILTISEQKKKELESQIRIIERIVAFEANFKENCSKSQEYPKTWHRERLLQQILENPPISDFKDYQRYENNTVFILGPEENVNKFRGSDRLNGVWVELLTKMHPFPQAQAHRDGWLYHNDQAFNIAWRKYFQYSQKDEIMPLCVLKTISYEVPENCQVIKPHPECDLYYSYDLIDKETHRILLTSLDKLANNTNDYFIENYQNIIDPNLTVMQQPEADKLDEIRGKQKEKVLRWTATDFLIDDNKMKKTEDFQGHAKICSPISNLDPMEYKELHTAVETVFNAALPLLSKLRRPALLLPGKVQSVIKAQRIYLNPGEEYSGVWHCDGKNEEIIAVILYYYRISEKLEGGDLEFMDRRSQLFWLHGDCDPDEFSNKDAKKYVQEKPHCRIPVKTGTLVVFSNYQFIHRVLRMHYNENEKGDQKAPGGLASRDFLAFFVVDQRSPLTSTIEFNKLEIKKKDEAEEIRKQLFLEQIEPTGSFGINEGVHSTGNGSVALLGWVQGQLDNPDDKSFKEFYHKKLDRSGLINLKLFNQSPPLERGISWAVEEDYKEKEEVKKEKSGNEKKGKKKEEEVKKEE